MADSAVLGGVVEVVSSIPTVGHKIIFQHLPALNIKKSDPLDLLLSQLAVKQDIPGSCYNFGEV